MAWNFFHPTHARTHIHIRLTLLTQIVIFWGKICEIIPTKFALLTSDTKIWTRSSTNRHENCKNVMISFGWKIVKIQQIRDGNLLNYWGRRAAKECKADRSRQELSNEDFVAKFVFSRIVWNISVDPCKHAPFFFTCLFANVIFYHFIPFPFHKDRRRNLRYLQFSKTDPVFLASIQERVIESLRKGI